MANLCHLFLSLIDGALVLVVFFFFQQKWVLFQGTTYAKQAAISWWSRNSTWSEGPHQGGELSAGQTSNKAAWILRMWLLMSNVLVTSLRL